MSGRVDREIEEILSRAGDFGRPGPDDPRIPPQKPSLFSRISRYLRGLSVSGQTMLLSLVLAVVAFALSSSFPQIAAVVTIVSVSLFASAYFKAFQGPKNIGPERRWRGQVIEYPKYGRNDLGWRLRRWWQSITRH
jgi:hypothetical protein